MHVYVVETFLSGFPFLKKGYVGAMSNNENSLHVRG